MLRDYITKQAALCAALDAVHAHRGDPMLLSVPKMGSVSLDDSFWEFQKHGKGVRFFQIPDGWVLDVPVGVAAYPHAIDAWRVWQHLESRQIDAVEFLGNEYPVLDPRSAGELLTQLWKKGLLSRIGDEGELFVLSDAASLPVA